MNNMKNRVDKKTNICMVVFSSYPLDVRVRREAEAITAAGFKVDVLCRTSRGELSKEDVRGVTTYRIKLDRKRSGKTAYLWEYFYFFMWAFWKVSVLNLTKRYRIVHVHNMPDFLVFTSIVPKIFGAKVILDLHDPMPELFTSIFKTSQQSKMYKILLKIEKLSIWYSDAVLTPNISFKNIFISRSCSSEKVNIIMNSPDENVFKYFDNTNRDEPIASNYVLMYHGAIIEQHGLDIGLKAVALLKDRIPNIKLIIFGDGNYLPYAKKIIDEQNLKGFVEIKGSVINDEIAKFIPQIDLGIIPNRSNLFTQLNFPVRIFEYITYKKAVVVPRTQGIKDYFDENAIYFFEPGNIQDLSETIYRIYQSKNEVQQVINKSYDVYRQYTWRSQKENLIKLVTELVNK